MIELVYDIAVVSDYKVVRSNHILQCCRVVTPVPAGMHCVRGCDEKVQGRCRAAGGDWMSTRRLIIDDRVLTSIGGLLR